MVITRDMTEAEYRAHPLPSWSAAKDLLHMSPAEWLHHQSKPRTESAAMAWGTLLHAMVLEPDTIGARYVVVGEVTRTEDGKRWTCGNGEDYRTKAEAEAALLADVGDRQALTAECLADARARAEQAAAVLGGSMLCEVPMQGAIEGCACKGKADVIDAGRLIDVKTSADVTPRTIARIARDRLWRGQLWTYGELARQCGYVRESPDLAVLVVQAASVSLAGGILSLTGWQPRAHARIVPLTPAAVEAGRNEARAVWSRLRECQLADAWPDYDGDSIDVSRWETEAEVTPEEW
jgi:hypothetical protein